MSADVVEVLRRAWGMALGVDVDDGDDFFALGGDSLRAVSVAAQLRDHLGIAVDPWWLYDHPSFLDARTSLVELVSLGQSHPVPSMVAGDRVGEHPLTHQQEGLLAVVDRVGDAHHYQVAYAVAFPSRDVGRLRTAVAALGMRHPALRTGLRQRAGRWVQHVDHHPVELMFSRTGHDSMRTASEWASEGVRLDSERLARIALIENSGGQLLVLAGHQLVLDPWSWGLVLRELSALYDDPDDDRPLPLAYSDYARWQRTHADPDYPRHLEYWRRQMDGFPPNGLRLPGAPGQADPAGPASVLPIQVPPSVVQALSAAAGAWRMPLFHVLLASFSLALARWSGQWDVLVGSATANRTVPGSGEVIGFFVNGRFTRAQLAPSATLDEVVGRISELWRAGEAHEQAHLEKTVVDLGVPDLVNVKFSYNEIPTLNPPLPTLGGAPVRPVGLGHPATSRRQVSLALAPDGDRLTGTLTYRTDVLDLTTAAGLSEEFEQMLHRAASGS